MSDKRKILIQLDGDQQASVFDRVVAIDAGVDELFSYGQVTREQVQNMVHGCIFTRGPKDLARTAIFIGGSDVAQAETLLAEAKKHLLPQFGLSVSIMLDPNGSNTTAAAAVRSATRHLDLSQTSALVMGAGAVGVRAALLLAQAGATVFIANRRLSKAEDAVKHVVEKVPGAKVTAVPLEEAPLVDALSRANLVIAAGPAGKQVLDARLWQASATIQVMIDLNAVPPTGIEGVEVMDAGVTRNKVTCYGALGVGGLKMKLHKAAIAQLFTSNQLILDTEAIYALSATL